MHIHVCLRETYAAVSVGAGVLSLTLTYHSRSALFTFAGSTLEMSPGARGSAFPQPSTC
jgi:hypothetical protein